jgi:hypothetical protein
MTDASGASSDGSCRAVVLLACLAAALTGCGADTADRQTGSTTFLKHDARPIGTGHVCIRRLTQYVADNPIDATLGDSTEGSSIPQVDQRAIALVCKHGPATLTVQGATLRVIRTSGRLVSRELGATSTG